MLIRNKIAYGYGIVLGIAFAGAAVGVAVGNYYQSRALTQRQIASRESQLLSELQLDVLYNRPAKQLSPYVQEPLKFQQESLAFLERIQQICHILQEHNQSGPPLTLPELQAFLEEYEGTAEVFRQKTEAFTKQAQPLTQSPNNSQVVQQLIVDLAQSSEFVAFIEAPDRMAEFYQLASQREAEAEQALEQAEALRTQIILGGLGLASAVAIILAAYISHAIAQPIQAVTTVAHKITDDSNFNLRVPTADGDSEVRVLGLAINSMVEQVQQLMDKQQAYTLTIEQANIAANAASQAKSDFLANISHELRTPLNGILGYAQILQRSGELAEKEYQAVQIIHQCGSHLLNLINEILDLAKIESGKLELLTDPVHLSSLLTSINGMCKVKAEEKGIDFIYQADSHLPDYVVTDEKRLSQVLINLLSNAIKFTDSGSVMLQVETIHSTKNHTIEQASLRFHIIDTGIGITEADQQKLFQSFEQVGDISKRAEGTGLGLSISQKIIQMMGSKIQVDSQFGQGTTFHFTLALPVANESHQQISNLAQPGKVIGYEGDRRHILIVDERWENRDVLRGLLTPLGFEISVAGSGIDAIKHLQDTVPDLLITNLFMPEMDGYELLKHVGNSEETQAIKILFHRHLYQKPIRGRP